jgi:deoxyribodipyrimidine photo-lyase
METVIVWFRNDLRLHDHEPLYKARQRTPHVVPVYCIDPQWFAPTNIGRPKAGAFRARFLWQALADLQQRLQALGSQLIIKIGPAAQGLAQVQAQTGASAVYTSKEATAEEILEENQVEAALRPSGCRLTSFWQATLYHPDDLPFPLKALPDVFTDFRKEVERGTKIRPQWPTTTDLAPLPAGLAADPPEAYLALPDFARPGAKLPTDPRAVLEFTGGETAGQARVQTYFWQNDKLRVYKETRNGLLGPDYSSKLSPWLALGCLSPRWVHAEVQRYEAKRVKNESTYWLVFELLWRDYFRFVAKKFGNRLFKPGGLKDAPPLARPAPASVFERWANAQTGIPFIDANMEELNQTGFMSNRGRQNVASFLVKDLRCNWQWAAQYFESLLIDYDPCSNWGNWNYVAGIGNDPRPNRYFNIMRQAKQYDPKGAYVKHWLPVLQPLPPFAVHYPAELGARELANYGVHLGGNYPKPMVNPAAWAKEA